MLETTATSILTNGHPHAKGKTATPPLPAFNAAQSSILASADAAAVSQDWLGRFAEFAKQAASGDTSGADKIFLEDGELHRSVLAAEACELKSGATCQDGGATGPHSPGTVVPSTVSPRSLRRSRFVFAYTLNVSPPLKSDFFLQATFGKSVPTDFNNLADPQPEINQPYPDIGFIQAHFSFFNKVGVCTAVVNLIPSPEGTFRAWTLSTVRASFPSRFLSRGSKRKLKLDLSFTSVEGLRDFPELERPNGRLDGVSTFEETRARNAAFIDQEPDVVIGTSVSLDLASYLHLTPQPSSVGAGHNGLVLAARLLQLGVKVLCVELNARPGDFWRQRCESLLLEVHTEGERLTVAPKQTRPSASTSLSGRVISTPRMANPNVTHNLTYRPPSVHGVSEAVADLHACCCASSSRRLSLAHRR